MGLRADWQAISGRVEGLAQASQVYLASIMARREDPYGAASKSLIPEAGAVFSEIDGFLSRHAGALPDPARASLEALLADGRDYFSGGLDGYQGVQALVPRLIAVRSAVEYHLRDVSERSRRATERAFVHLQRSIVADPTVRRTWKYAFKEGEVACERLGGAHLLMHGVWAFKAHATGERTDLVLGEPLVDLQEVEATSEALVLTEWKRIDGAAAATRTAEAAREQAALYATGGLAGIELASYRYIVLVSQKRIELPGNHEQDSVVYRHINIAVDPDVPSRGIEHPA